jgi:hypothetical protein
MVRWGNCDVQPMQLGLAGEGRFDCACNLFQSGVEKIRFRTEGRYESNMCACALPLGTTAVSPVQHFAKTATGRRSRRRQRKVNLSLPQVNRAYNKAMCWARAMTSPIL